MIYSMMRLAFISFLLTGYCSATFTYKAEITDSPSMHNVTRTVTLDDLKKSGYDITKFSVEIGLKNPEETIDNLLINRLGINQDNPVFETYRKNEIMRKFLLDFQKAEAEGVFYRDIKHILDKNNETLKGNSEYEAKRNSNNQLVNKWFDATESSLSGSPLMTMSLKNAKAALREVEFRGQKMKNFEKIILEYAEPKLEQIQELKKEFHLK